MNSTLYVCFFVINIFLNQSLKVAYCHRINSHRFYFSQCYFFFTSRLLTVLHGETEAEHLKRVQCFCPSAYVMRLFTRKGALLQPSQADAPLPACFVCGGSEITLQVNPLISSFHVWAFSIFYSCITTVHEFLLEQHFDSHFSHFLRKFFICH